MGNSTEREGVLGEATDRRKVITGVAATAAAAVAAVLARSEPARASAGDAFYLGQVNDAGTATTELDAHGDGDALVIKSSGGNGGALRVESETNNNPVLSVVRTGTAPGVFGGNSVLSAVNLGPGEALFGMGATGGVAGLARIPGPNPGTWTPGVGVYGKSGSGPGVQGESMTGRGVYGKALQPGATALAAENTVGGLALDVTGKSRFSTAGVGAIPAGATSTTIAAPVDPATSVVLITPMADTQRQSLYVQIATGSFTVNINDKSHPAIPFGWLAIEKV
jgi:hypothetical protein